MTISLAFLFMTILGVVTLYSMRVYRMRSQLVEKMYGELKQHAEQVVYQLDLSSASQFSTEPLTCNQQQLSLWIDEELCSQLADWALSAELIPIQDANGDWSSIQIRLAMTEQHALRYFSVYQQLPTPITQQYFDHIIEARISDLAQAWQLGPQLELMTREVWLESYPEEKCLYTWHVGQRNTQAFAALTST